MSWTWLSNRLCKQIPDVDPRGGATIVAAGDRVVIFGGANREQVHYGDVIICSMEPKEAAASCASCELKDGYDNREFKSWKRVETTGDVPPPRSGHAVVAYGDYMILFGGIDFAEEAAYNDLYTLDLKTLEWKYIGEAGSEILPRNSHCLGIMDGPTGTNDKYLVVYGGASPEQGVFDEIFYALIPEFSQMKERGEEFYVTWQSLERDPNGPGGREMHSSCTMNGKLIISGGRNEAGTVLSDTWSLSNTLKWERRHDLELPVSRCAHGAAVVGDKYCIYGGFTGVGVAGDLATIRLSTEETVFGTVPVDQWVNEACSIDIGARFGLALCGAPKWLIHLSTPKKAENAAIVSDISYETGGLLVFGGVSVENDFGDVWILSPKP